MLGLVASILVNNTGARCVPVFVATADDTHKLWRNIESHLRNCLHNVYLREVTGFVLYHITCCFDCFIDIALKLCNIQN